MNGIVDLENQAVDLLVSLDTTLTALAGTKRTRPILTAGLVQTVRAELDAIRHRRPELLSLPPKPTAFEITQTEARAACRRALQNVEKCKKDKDRFLNEIDYRDRLRSYEDDLKRAKSLLK